MTVANLIWVPRLFQGCVNPVSLDLKGAGISVHSCMEKGGLGGVRGVEVWAVRGEREVLEKPSRLGFLKSGLLLLLALASGVFGGNLLAGGLDESERALLDSGGQPRDRQQSRARVSASTEYYYPADTVNHPYPFTPKFVWRAMFPSIQERIAAEHHAIGVGGAAAKELAFYRETERHPNRVRHEVGRVIDPGIHYLGGGWTRMETTRGDVLVYNPRNDPFISAVAPANRAAVSSVEKSLDRRFGRQAPGYYNAQGHRVPKGDPSAVLLVGSGGS